jgi:glycosyltransferase involved in cell wall biosynthesis
LIKKASVLILTYNSSKFIAETLDSVLNQEYPNFEIVIGDDCSTDNTVKIIQSYQKISSQSIQLIASMENKGITSNFNKCLDLCTGDYIFLLGGDDIFLPGKIQAQISYMENNKDIFISYHDVDVFNSCDQRHLYFYNKDRHGFHFGNVEKLLLQGTFNCGCSTAIRNINLPYCDIEIKYSSDWLWYMEILAKSGKKIGYFDGVYAKYRRHSGNITTTSKVEMQAAEVFLTLEKIIKKYPPLKHQYKIARAERGFVFLLKYLISGDFKRSTSHIDSIWSFIAGAFYFAKRRILKRI